MVFNIPPDWSDFVSGTRFSAGKTFSLARQPAFSEDRLNLLEEMVRGKRVIHFGFADHPPLIESKIKSNRWLHGRLMRSAVDCVGLDCNSEAVNYVVNEIGVPGCYVYDLFEDAVPDELTKTRWDVVIMGEIIEHVDDPVFFLKEIKRKFAHIATQLLVTAPNGLSLENALFSLKNKECINTDHRYWFSPFTLTKVGYRAGLEVNRITMCGEVSGRSSLYSFLTSKIPMFRETIVAEFQLAHPQKSLGL
jgi:hypothetical protein